MSMVPANALQLTRYTRDMRAQLEAFYNAFEPKGSALGLPPRTPEAVGEWLDYIRAYPGFVMRDGERIVGHALLCPETYTAEVAVFVSQEYRGRGVGKRLLQAVIAEAVDLDLRRIWGVSEPDNVAMLRLAHSCGFLPGEELGEFYLDSARLHELMPRMTGTEKK